MPLSPLLSTFPTQTSRPASPLGDNVDDPVIATAAAYTAVLAVIMAEAAAAAAGHGAGGGGGAAASASSTTTTLSPATPFADAGLDSLDMMRVRVRSGRERKGREREQGGHKAVKGATALTPTHPSSQVAAAVGAALNLRLPSTALFDHPTPAALAAAVLAMREGSAAAQDATPTAARPSPVPRPRRTSFADLFATGGGSGGGITAAPAAPTRPTLGDVLGRRPSVAASLLLRGAPPDACLSTPPSPARVWIAATSLRSPAGEAGGPLASHDAAAPVPHTRWDVEAGRGYPLASRARFAAFLRNVAAFDPAAFGMSPAEAAAADPQQRLLLESAADLLNGGGGRGHPSSASSSASSLRRPVAVIVGVSYTDAALLAADRDGHAGRVAPADPAASDPAPHAAAAGALSVVAGRVSFAFGLAGPAVAVDTACSSALVGTALAAREVASPATPWRAALAAGACLALAPRTAAAYAAAAMLAPDGRCKALDADADGFGRAETVGGLALVAEVIGGASGADADSTAAAWLALPGKALLAGTAVNQDGRSSSLTAPSGPAQAALLRAALASAAAGIGDGFTTTLPILALHGTGTPLGDPIEVSAAAGALVLPPPSSCPLTLLAPKAVAGHAEPAAGLVAVVMGIAALGGGAGVGGAPPGAPSIAHLRALNPHVRAVLDASRSPASLPRSAGPLAAGSGAAARLGVSAFAFQGTNAHVILGKGGQQGGRALLSSPSPPALPFRRARCWAAPRPHALLHQAVAAASPGLASFELPALDRTPGLAALVGPRSALLLLLPSLLADAAVGALRALAGPALDNAPACLLLGLAWPAAAPAEAVLTLAVSAGDGRVQVAAPGGACVLSGWAGAAAGGGWAPAAATLTRRPSPLLRRQAPPSSPVTTTASAAWTHPSPSTPAFALTHPALLAAAWQAAAMARGADEKRAASLHPAAAACLAAPGGSAALASAAGHVVAGPEGMHAVALAPGQAPPPPLFAVGGAAWADGPPPPTATTPASTTLLHSPSSPPQQVKHPARMEYRTVWRVSEPADLGGYGRATAVAAAAASSPAHHHHHHALASSAAAATPATTAAALLHAIHPGPGRPRRLALVTTAAGGGGGGGGGGPARPPGTRSAAPSSSSLWALLRCAQAEDAALAVAALDLDGWGAVTPSQVAAGLLDQQQPAVSAMGRARLGGATAVACLERHGAAAPSTSSPSAALITGGAGGLGGLVGAWVAAGQAPTRVLALGRRAHALPPPLLAAASDAASTSLLTLASCDTTAAADCAGAAGLARRLLPSSPTIFHAAGTINDAPLASQTAASLRGAAAPKAGLAVLSLTLNPALPSPSRVLFSSVAAVLGPPGSVAYAAANAGLDAAAARAAGTGLAGTMSAAWGAWSGVGMVADNAAVAGRMARAGVEGITAVRGLAALGRLVKGSASPVTVLPVDWAAFRAAAGRGVAAHAASPFFRGVSCGGGQAGTAPPTPAAAAPPPPKDDGAAASTAAAAAAAVAAALAAVLGPDAAAAAAADPGAPLAAVAGLDSLAAVELRDELRRVLGVALPATLAFDAPTRDALVGAVRRAVSGGGGGSGSRSGPATTTTSTTLPPPPLSTPSSAPAPTPASPLLITIDAIAARLPGPPLCAAATGTGPTPDTARPAPLERWDASRLPPPSGAGFGRFLPCVAAFDAAAFGVSSAAEAVRMDPQQRLLLEVGAEVVLGGGWGGGDRAPPHPSSHVAVATALSFWDYASLAAAAAAAAAPTSFAAAGDAHAATGRCLSVAAGRLAFAFDFRGPALAVDTACSSTLVGAALLAGELRAGLSSAALLAGALLSLDHATVRGLAAAGMLAPDGRCKTLDAAADGYGRGEGAVAIGLSAAGGREGRPLALLASVAVNQDGRSAASLTAPSGPAQGRVIQAAWKEASADQPLHCAGLELHGTGTPLGDPIEVGAAAGAAPPCPALPLSAAKAGAGHTEPAAGAVGLAHALARLGSRSAGAPLPGLAAPSRFVAESLAGRAAHASRVAGPGGGAEHARPRARPAIGVSAFAFQGTNAHAVVVKGHGSPDDGRAVTLLGGDGRSSPLPLRRARVWFAPTPARLAAAFTSTSTTAAAALFTTPLASSPPLAYLSHHVVRGRPILPGTAMLEAGRAGLGCLLAEEDGDGAGVAGGAVAFGGVALLAPLLLTGPGISLSVSVDVRNGAMVVGSGGSGGLGRLATGRAVRVAGAAAVASGQADPARPPPPPGTRPPRSSPPVWHRLDRGHHACSHAW